MANVTSWLDSASSNTIDYTLVGHSNVIPGALVYSRADKKKETHYSVERVTELLAKGDLTITEVKIIEGVEMPYKMSLKKGNFDGGSKFTPFSLG